MSNQLVPVSFGGVPQLPAEFMDLMRQQMNNDFSGFSGGTFRRIKPRKVDFILHDGGNQESIPHNGLYAVLIGAAPHNHCIWYARDYAPGQEAGPPDLVWIQPSPDVFPAALPQQFRQKVMRNGAERWAFQICRRTVWAIIRNSADGQMSLDLERPYVLDLTAMSMFGKSKAENNFYRWGGLKTVCDTHSNSGFVCTPSMFITQIVIDTDSPMSGVVMFKPMRDANGNLSLLDGGTIMKVHECRMRQSTQDMLTVHEKLDYEALPEVPAAAPQQPVAAPVPQSVPVAAPIPQPTLLTPAPQPVAAPAPQPVAPAPDAAPVNNSMESLLAQAQQLLNSQNAAPQPTPVPQPAPVAAPVPQPVAPAEAVTPPPAPPVAPVASAPAGDAMSAQIGNLLQQLG